eukprot:13273112-Heterocapsa_arctica.AAC.1
MPCSMSSLDLQKLDGLAQNTSNTEGYTSESAPRWTKTPPAKPCNFSIAKTYKKLMIVDTDVDRQTIYEMCRNITS